jgi:hypothetical protein
VAKETVAVDMRSVRYKAAMALLETVACDAATIIVQEHRRTAAAHRELMEAASIDVADNVARMDAAARQKSYYATMQRRRVAWRRAAALATAWGLLGKEEEE